MKGSAYMSSKKKITKDLIIQTAFIYVDKHGLESLSMRKLASELGIKAMSLYNHISNKDEVIDLLVEEVMMQVQYEDDEHWQKAISNRAHALKDVLIKHGWAIWPILSRPNMGAYFISDFDRSIGIFIESGFTYKQADQIISSINSYIYGYVLQTLHFPIETDSFQETAEEYKDFAPKETLPYLWGMTNEVRLGKYNGIIDFDTGLGFIIKGIEQMFNKKEKKHES